MSALMVTATLGLSYKSLTRPDLIFFLIQNISVVERFHCLILPPCNITRKGILREHTQVFGEPEENQRRLFIFHQTFLTTT